MIVIFWLLSNRFVIYSKKCQHITIFNIYKNSIKIINSIKAMMKHLIREDNDMMDVYSIDSIQGY